ncbi:hypothetical protein [Asticcacaulis sp. AC402]|uniref:hypothetical protein n=1 Tax=Asticcacaulis sp. AC402 TaxID=1282361 RepID=UPI0003C3BD22|nr:hypothetical protein [Asticcacaulis sp. AC402]ESQ74712.1 hypothetical protein ABAC402_12465 [Asticcacaulis sp. AC402]
MTEHIAAERAMEAAMKAQADISTHEQVCAERYARIDDGLITVKSEVSKISDRVNLMLLATMGGLFAVVMALVFK